MGLDDLKKKYPQLQRYSRHLIGITIPIPGISSTLIREKRSQGKDTRSLEAVGVTDFLNKRGLYLPNNKYVAFTCARERFLEQYKDQPIAAYIEELMGYLQRLDQDPVLQEQEISRMERK